MTYDAQRKAVRTDGGRWLHLTPIEAIILEILLEQPGYLVTYKQFAIAIPSWDRLGEVGFVNSMRNHISRLRDKIGEDAIISVVGFGYLFNPGIEHTCRECGRFM